MTFNEKHNEANGENNNDGANDNRSWNCGAEGETDSQEINTLRGQQKRNLLTTLFLSQGIPMLLAGDELNNSQSGNNNTYCQDSEIGWVNWDNADDGLIEFVGELTKLRKQHNAISRAEFVTGNLNEHGNPDVTWFNVNGEIMSNEQWDDPNNKAMGIKFDSPVKNEPAVLVFINASHVDVLAKLPCCDTYSWKQLINTKSIASHADADNQIKLLPRSVYVYEGNLLNCIEN